MMIIWIIDYILEYLFHKLTETLDMYLHVTDK